MTKNQSLRKTYAYRNRNVHSISSFSGPNGYSMIPAGVVSSLVVHYLSSRIAAIYFTDGSELHIGNFGDATARRIAYTHEGKTYGETLEWIGTNQWRKRPTQTPAQAIEAEVAARTKQDGGLVVNIKVREPEQPQSVRETEYLDRIHKLEGKVAGLHKQLKELSVKHSNQAHTISRMQERARGRQIEYEKRTNQLKAVEKIANDRGLVIQQLTAAHHWQNLSRAGLAGVLKALMDDSVINPLLNRLGAQGDSCTYGESVGLAMRVHGQQAADSAKLFEAAVGDSKQNGCTAIQDMKNELERATPKAGTPIPQPIPGPPQPTVDAPWSSPEFRSDGWVPHPHSSRSFVYKGQSVISMSDYAKRFGKPYKQ